MLYKLNVKKFMTFTFLDMPYELLKVFFAIWKPIFSKDRGFDVNFLNFDWWFIQFLTWLMFSLEMRPHCNVVTF